MVSALLNAILFIVILGVVWYILKMLPLPAPAGKILDILFILIAVLIVLGALGVINVGTPQLLRL